MPKVKVEFKTTASKSLAKLWLEDEELVPDKDGIAEATVTKRKTPYLLTWMVRGTPSDTVEVKVIEPEADSKMAKKGPITLGGEKINVGVHPIYKGTQP